MSKYYIIEKSRLKSLLLQEIKLAVYESCGLDNYWSGYKDDDKELLLDQLKDWNEYAKEYRKRYNRDCGIEDLKEFVFDEYAYQEILQDVVEQDIEFNYTEFANTDEILEEK